MTPRRIQRRRTKGWRMPLDTISVGRPSLWGNRFRPGTMAVDPVTGNDVHVVDLAHAVDLFRADWQRCLVLHPTVAKAALAPLRGKHLACWCQLGQPCHADVLLEIANV